MTNGIFDLENSDETVSSYYKISDLVTMINKRLRNEAQIDDLFLRTNFNNLMLKVDGYDVVNEGSGFKEIWSSKKIVERKLNPKNINHYELVLYSIFSKVVGEENVHVQYPINGKGHKYDFMVENEGKKYLIEFEGIGHYRPNRGRIPDNPLQQLTNFKNSDFKLVLWPYWIQRCELNLKVILGTERIGLGAIWGSNYHFGHFIWDDSYNIIRNLNTQFNIDRNKEIGYIYEAETVNRNNPENPVIGKILNPRKTAWTVEKILIPKGTPDNLEERNYWLPQTLKNFSSK